MDNDFEGKPNPKDIVALIVVLFILLVFGLIWYAVCQIADVTVQIFDETAESVRDWSKEKSKQLEKLQRQIDRLDRY